ncbi:MAG: ACP S-malonyltransferase [Pseudomonadota bacterium]|uniref:ACP S-malonyltransferase n=1 Tax=Thermithiobacillus tepidarius TaxID=929 RepID=UPI0003FEBBBB|nr:ACP S-malonyltransferase [Thermithiobacillus tepidarius]
MLGSTAFVFPGQGSQSVGMLAALAQAFPSVQETFAEASDILSVDLWQLAQEGPAELLNQTVNTQPAMLAAGVAIYRVWIEESGAAPDFMAGHSLGEYTALVCAESLAFRDAVALVADRARFMQEAVPEGTGGMVAVLGMQDEDVINLCQQQAQGEVLEPANFNSPGQLVVSGHLSAVQRLAQAATEAGAKKVVVLPVSIPSHCSLMRPAAERLAARLEQIEIQTPKMPVVNNVDVKTPTQSEQIKDALVRQLYSPVRWTDTVRFLARQGMSAVVEMGPGRVLTGLSKRIDRTLVAMSIDDPASLDAAMDKV